jgi:hypothetical protein
MYFAEARKSRNERGRLSFGAAALVPHQAKEEHALK